MRRFCFYSFSSKNITTSIANKCYYSSSTFGASIIPGRSPPQPRLDSIKPHLRELAIRSASAREAIREAVRAASVEVGLRHFQDFLDLHEFSPAELNRLAEHHDIDRMRIMLDLFRNWYMETKAPKLTQMNAPWEWFPKARMMRRRFVFHGGPTNSGKTHAALEKLMSAKSGVYCAPLKALASQVWLRVNERVSCDLLIGDERQFAGSAEHVSCTVEMTPIELGVDVAVIDEIQLIEDPERGWAWTRALLGLPAREIHLCGEARALPIVKKLLWYTREAGRIEIRDHRRLVPLDLENQSLNGRLDSAEAGDCFVCFSRKSVFDTAKQLKVKNPDAQVHVVYGGLPFSVREYESNAFNSGTEKGEFHVLVATDAIAYGLNLSIRRIIFSTMRKFDGNSMQQLSPPSLLQIAGRAGRFGRKFSDHGYVTTLHSRDYNLLESTMKKGANALPQVQRAGLLPTADVLAVYAGTVPHLKFHEMMHEFSASCSVLGDTFFVCDMVKSLLGIAEAISDVPMLSTMSGGGGGGVADKILFCFAPMSVSSQQQDEGMKFLRRLAIEHGAGGPVKLKIDQEVEKELIPKVNKILGKKFSSDDEKQDDEILFDLTNHQQQDDEILCSSSNDCTDSDFVGILESFYRKHNPSKVSDALSLYQKYPDRRKLLNGLKAKYNVTSVVEDQEDVIRLVMMKNRREKNNDITITSSSSNNNNITPSQLAELQEVLRRCETLYRWVEVYGWLAWRFPKTFVDLKLSAKTKSDLVKLIDHLLKCQVQN